MAQHCLCLPCMKCETTSNVHTYNSNSHTHTHSIHRIRTETRCSVQNTCHNATQSTSQRFSHSHCTILYHSHICVSLFTSQNIVRVLRNASGFPSIRSISLSHKQVFLYISFSRSFLVHLSFQRLLLSLSFFQQRHFIRFCNLFRLSCQK